MSVAWKYTLVPIRLLRSWCTQTVGTAVESKSVARTFQGLQIQDMQATWSLVFPKHPVYGESTKIQNAESKRCGDLQKLTDYRAKLLCWCLNALLFGWCQRTQHSGTNSSFCVYYHHHLSSLVLLRLVLFLLSVNTQSRVKESSCRGVIRVNPVLNLYWTRKVLVQARSKTQKWDASWLMSKIVSSSCTVQDI